MVEALREGVARMRRSSVGTNMLLPPPTMVIFKGWLARRPEKALGNHLQDLGRGHYLRRVAQRTVEDLAALVGLCPRDRHLGLAEVGRGQHVHARIHVHEVLLADHAEGLDPARDGMIAVNYFDVVSHAVIARMRHPL